MADENGAVSRYDRPYEIVSAQIDAMSDRADTAISKAYLALAELQKLQLDLDSLPDTPQVSMPDGGISAFPPITAPSAGSFGGVNGINIPNIDISTNIDDVQIDDAPEFNPSVLNVNIPAAPASIVLGNTPDKPVLVDIDLPSAPSLAMPEVGQLLQISVPEFVFPELPVFDARSPEFDGTAPSVVLQWIEPAYSSQTLDDVTGRVREQLKGGTGIPPAVEAALFDRARAREDMAGNKAVDDAFQDFASRGFMLPPGMLAKRIDAVREANQIKVSELAREIMIKSAEWEIENLRNAVERGIALETMLVAHSNDMAQRGFEVAKLRLQADIDLYNSSVTLFNARQSAYQVEAQVFQTRLQGELSRLEVFKAQIDAEHAKGELNQQTVAIYTAQVQALNTQIDIYKANMQGAQIKSDINRSQIEGYRADIQAYAERISAQKIEFDVYETQVRAEQAKIGILEAESRAFAATVQAYESKNNVKIQGIRSKVEVSGAKISQYNALLAAEQARVQAELGSIQAVTAAFTADVGRYTAEINGASAERQLQATVLEGKLRNNLAYYEIELKKYDASITRMIQQVQIQSDAAKATGTMAAQLAAGAMSATNVSASMSGGANITSSDSLSKSTSTSYNHQYNHDEG